MKDTWPSLGAGVAFLILVTIVVYLPALQGRFVWDDNTLIIRNRLIQASDGLYRFWFTTEARDYYPLTGSFWWIQWRLWGDNATGYHAVNVLLHAVNVVAIWILLRRLTIPGAWWIALVFAIHPVNVATVAWISEQRNTLSMFFSLVAILLYLKFDEESFWRWLGFSLAAFLLALLAKSAVVMLPVVLFGCLWWQHGRVRRKDVLFISPFFVLSLALGVATIWFQYHRVLNGGTRQADGFLSRLVTAGCAPWFYLYKALLPFDLSAVYPGWDINPARWTSYLPGTALIGCFALFWRKRKTWGRPLLFGLGCFVIMLFPVLEFFDQDFQQYSFVADPWQYYSIVGIIGLAVAAVMSIGRRLDRQQQSWASVAALAVLLALGSSTWTRASVYASEETLWEDTVAKNPNGWVVHYNLGIWLLETARFDKAIVQFRDAARLRPDLAKVHSNLGIALAQDDKLPEAAAEFEQALQIDPHLFEVQGNLGHVLVLLGRTPEAMAHWEQALRIKPDSAEVHYDLGMALEQTGKPDAAIEQYELALKFKPDMVDAQNQLTRLRAGQQSLH
jgi:Flp pilus assembly protein TadD